MALLQSEYDAALRSAAVARDGLRASATDDRMLDYWAMRLVFWNDETRRLKLIVEATEA